MSWFNKLSLEEQLSNIKCDIRALLVTYGNIKPSIYYLDKLERLRAKQYKLEEKLKLLSNNKL